MLTSPRSAIKIDFLRFDIIARKRPRAIPADPATACAPFPALWFSIYKQVIALNEKLDKDRLDKSALREVVTSIFIASTQKGITRPRPMTKFHSEILTLVASVHEREKQEMVFNTVKALVSNGTNGKNGKSEGG